MPLLRPPCLPSLRRALSLRRVLPPRGVLPLRRLLPLPLRPAPLRRRITASRRIAASPITESRRTAASRPRLRHPEAGRLGRAPAARRGAGRDRGQVAIEYVGLLPILLLVGVACVQLGLAVYAVQQAGTAARAAARVASQAHTPADPQAAGRAAVSDWLSASISRSGGGFDSVTYTARVHVPSIIPGVGFGTAQRSVTMPRD